MLMAVNTHFDHVGTEAHRCRALLIINRTRQIANGLPAVLAGDFSVDEHSEAYQTITAHPFVLLDAQKVAQTIKGVKNTFP